jgi:hypothetical protein
LLGFKSLNYVYNRHFDLTNRATMALYGNLTMRAQYPLNGVNFLSHLSTISASYSLCNRFFPDKYCDHWSMSSSDETYLTRQDQLQAQDLNPAQEEKFFDQGIFRALVSHPLTQTVYIIQEGMKMFFWETCRGAFVVYPPWIERLADIPIIIALLSLGIGSLCLIGFLTACFLCDNELILITIVLTGLLVILFGFINIIHRYAIIAAPLMILINASCLSALSAKFGKGCAIRSTP